MDATVALGVGAFSCFIAAACFAMWASIRENGAPSWRSHLATALILVAVALSLLASIRVGGELKYPH